MKCQLMAMTVVPSESYSFVQSVDSPWDQSAAGVHFSNRLQRLMGADG